MSIKLIWRTDVHLSDTAPASRTDDWAATVLHKLRQIGQIATKLKADAVLDGGDFFHVKSPTRNSHSLVQRVAEVHAQAYGNVPIYGNVGNHDCVYGDYDFLNQQPLGVLFSTGVFKRCYDEHEATFTDETGYTVRVVGIPYHGTTYDMTRFSRIKKGSEDVLICMAHVLASPAGGSMFEGEDIVKYSDLEDYAPDVFCMGHWHKDQGVTVLPHSGKQVVNIGSLTRGALSQDEMQRKPGVAVVTCSRELQTPQIQVVRLPVAEATTVFDVVGRQRQETRATTMDSFVDNVRRQLVETGKQDLTEVLSTMTDVPDKVRERVLLYLERAQ